MLNVVPKNVGINVHLENVEFHGVDVVFLFCFVCILNKCEVMSNKWLNSSLCQELANTRFKAIMLIIGGKLYYYVGIS